jgi:hypothetical protein
MSENVSFRLNPFATVIPERKDGKLQSISIRAPFRGRSLMNLRVQGQLALAVLGFLRKTKGKTRISLEEIPAEILPELIDSGILVHPSKLSRSVELDCDANEGVPGLHETLPSLFLNASTEAPRGSG